MMGLLLYVALGVLQIGLTLWAGVVSVKSLPPTENKAKHLVVFVLLGLFTVALTVAAGVSNYKDQETARADRNRSAATQQQLQNTLEDTRGKLDFMRGQLTSLVENIGSDKGLNSTQMSALLKKVLAHSTTSSPNIPPTGASTVPPTSQGQNVSPASPTPQPESSDKECVINVHPNGVAQSPAGFGYICNGEGTAKMQVLLTPNLGLHFRLPELVHGGDNGHFYVDFDPKAAPGSGTLTVLSNGKLVYTYTLPAGPAPR